ncbi:arylsulfatase precursor [Metarhizium album ARSEF 1941]|uniref:Arylsulfatase n=1 Tax=Metarhizium album (strain ARSEF 1941) TaxID=1081103 RepID=A0A0B2WHA3_METAS|nr:arylsulfatase precursor [Metarhizium album ARSEF 1941]KHN95381.1 arylsulfatase precursor [Metarhizium album ARSEF 1941]
MATTLFLLATLGSAFIMAAGTGQNQTLPPRPNFVFIMTDDQDVRMKSLDYQDVVKEQLMKKGTTFTKHFCTVSVCCPSRVSLLTGKAAHNTNVTSLTWPYGGYLKFTAQGLNDAYLPVWLQNHGYNTYYTGKLMNDHSTTTYNKTFANGWTRSDFLLDPHTYSYTNSVMALDKEEYRSIKGLYSTDFIANRSLEFLGNAVAAGKPFFLGVAPVGPHSYVDSGRGFSNPVPAERHKNLFPGVRVPRSANFNPSKPGDASYLKTLPRLSSTQVSYLDGFYRSRLQALQSIDDMVGRIVDALDKTPSVLANTYIIYTSDNGYHLGQHRLPPGKACNIEEDINVPFIVRGPGVAQGQEVSLPTSHTDIVPTLFRLARLPLHDDFDGVPMPVTPDSRRQKAHRHPNEHVNVEYWGGGNHDGQGVFEDSARLMRQNTYKTLRLVGRDHDLMYAVWCTNEHQLYDMRDDPYQMKNLYGTKGNTSRYSIPALTARLDTLLLTLKNCKGKVCREPWRTLFPGPDDAVVSLDQAMDAKYDGFFAKQEKVTFSKCAYGQLLEFEGALRPAIYKDSRA